MRKIPLLPLLIIFLSTSLSAMSISHEALYNPFPSRENLEAFDFQERPIEFDDIDINLITTETGGEIYSYFGHTSLELLIPGYAPIFYDYGYFSFSDGFYLNFFKGLLYYNVYATDGSMRLRQFKTEDRTVHATKLDLSSQMKNAIFSYLRFNTQRENNTYLYDYYLDNCATRVRDIYNEATGGDFEAWADGIMNGGTLRSSANLYLDKNPLISFTLNFLEGPMIDRPASLYQQCFLPITLMNAVQEYESQDSITINQSESHVTYRTHSLEFWSLLFSVVLYFTFLALYSSKRSFLIRTADILSALIFLYLTILSSVLLLLMCFTNHAVTYWNANLLYANPLLLIMAAEALRGKTQKKRYIYSLISISLIAFAVIMKALFPLVFIQQNLSVLMIMASLYLVNITRRYLSTNR